MVHFWLDPTVDIEVSEEEIQAYIDYLKSVEESDNSESDDESSVTGYGAWNWDG